MMTIRQTKIMIDAQAIDVKIAKQGQHMNKTLHEVKDLRDSIQDVRENLGQKV